MMIVTVIWGTVGRNINETGRDHVAQRTCTTLFVAAESSSFVRTPSVMTR